MTEQIEAAMKAADRASRLDVTDTKTQALAKLDKMRNKVGYPDVWRDYSTLTISANDFYGNVARANQFRDQAPARPRSASQSIAASGA